MDEIKKQIWRGGNMLYPVPAVMVSCGGEGMKSNIITLAWTGTICSSPAMVSISIRPERYSYDIIRKSGEFVINLTTKRLVKAMDWCGVRSGRDVDKFKEMRLTAQRGVVVNAPIIAESPVNLECRVCQVIELGSHHMFISTVEKVDITDDLLDRRGKLDLEKADLIVYSHGTYYGLGETIGTFGYSVRRQQTKGQPVKKQKTKHNRTDITGKTKQQIRKK